MDLTKDDLTAAFARQLDLARSCFDFGVEAPQRILRVQMDGARELFELQGRHLQFEEANADADEMPLQWMKLYRQAIAGGAEATLMCFRTAAAVQIEASRLAEEFVPEINRSLLGGIDRSTWSALAFAPEPKAKPRAQAA
jgi:hypothetical protein